MQNVHYPAAISAKTGIVVNMQYILSSCTTCMHTYIGIHFSAELSLCDYTIYQRWLAQSSNIAAIAQHLQNDSHVAAMYMVY